MAYVYSINGKFKVCDIDENCDVMELSKHFEDFFEVDTLIASSVALLNEKGYKTEMSCSGHYIPLMQCVHKTPEERIKGTIIEVVEDKIVDRYVLTDIEDKTSFINFREKQNFINLPLGWGFRNDIQLYYEYAHNISETEFYIQRSKAMKQLYDWVSDL